MSQSHQQQPSAEAIRRQMAMQEEQQNSQTAHQIASSRAQSGQLPGQEDANMAQFFTDVDLNIDDDDEFGAALSTEFSRHFMTGYLSDEQFEREYWRTDIEMDLIAMEYRDEKTALDDKDMQNMYPEYDTSGNPAPKPVLTDTFARRLNSAGRVKQAALSKSRYGKLIDALTKIHSVVQNEKKEAESTGGGLGERLRRWI